MFGTIVSQIAGIIWTGVESIFTIVISTVFSAVMSFLPTYKLMSSINSIISIDGLVCGLLGLPIVSLSIVLIKFVRKNITKSIKK